MDQSTAAVSASSPRRLLNSTGNHFNTPPDAIYFDGARLVCFTDFQDVPRPSTFDKFRRWVEDSLGFRIDWWPLCPIWYECLPGFTRISWEWSTLKFYIDLPTMVADKYISESCTPVHMLSEITNPISSQGNTTTSTQHHDECPADGDGESTNPSALGSTSELYWCVTESFRKPQRTWLCAEACHTIESDCDLCTRVKRRYNSVRGFLGRCFSWKKCVDIEFIRVSVRDSLKIKLANTPERCVAFLRTLIKWFVSAQASPCPISTSITYCTQRKSTQL